MTADHRREIYSATDPNALQVPEAVGPDGIPVTLRVEPAIDRLRRWRNMTSVPEVVTAPLSTYVGYRIVPDWVQKHLLRDRWVVDVEADSGDRCRVRASNRAEAVEIARKIHAGISAHGVAFLATFARN
jgi:hypothetical protein